MEKKKEQNQTALKKVKEDSFGTKFIKSIKKRWLISRTNTILLIAILIAGFILINSVVAYFDFTAIDCTTSQDFSLTEESKERVKNIEDKVNVYFIGWDETDQNYILAKQYHKANSNINVEIIDATKNLQIADKYEVTNEDMAIIIENGDISRTLTYYDIFTYDGMSTAEQKITSAIVNVTAGEIPKAYFLTGYTSLSIGANSNGLQGLTQYLDDAVLTYEDLNILNTQKVPDDCDTLIIMTPEKDFDKITADEIIKYINKGGNILWLNGAYPQKIELPNVNKVLAEYGIEGFEQGYVYETDSKNTIMGYPMCFMPNVQNTEVTKDVTQNAGAVFLYPTKININSDKLSELNIQKTDLISTTDTTYFTTDATGEATKENSTQGPFTIGTQMVKTISEDSKEAEDTENSEENPEDAIESTLIIYGNDYFITDQPLQDGSQNTYYMIYLANNADLCLNSIAYLTNQDQEITIRKSYSDSITSFTPTDAEKENIILIISVVPVAIILLGIIVWIIRKRRI